MTWPLALVITTRTLSTDCGSSMPYGVVCASPSSPCSISRRSPGTSTPWPISAVACRVCPACIWSVIPFRVRLRSSIPLTVLICASWVVISWLSMGSSGSWCCIWAISSVMKLLRSSADWLASRTPGPPWFIREMTCGSMVFDIRLALAQGECLEHHLLAGVHHLNVGLVGARGGDHVDHFMYRLNVGHGDIALFVGQRVFGAVVQR